MAKELSVLIPSRNEEWLARTVQDLLDHSTSDFEILIGLDGAPSVSPLPNDPRIAVVYYPKSIGQRAMTNKLCKLSKAKYVAKVDAHCAFDQGWDTKMISVMQDNWTMAPAMRNLHVFNWRCPDGHERYQGPSGPCDKCGKITEKNVVWIPKHNPSSTTFCFDAEPHFQYFNEFKQRPEWKNEVINQSMSLQGSFFMLTREKYWELDICSEEFGSWGSQGIEVAVKTWLSGGEVRINRNTWYAHMFRTQGGDFSFPYSISGNQVERAKKHARELFYYRKWPLQQKPLSWLVEKFWPVRGWTDRDLRLLKRREQSQHK